MCYLFGVKYEIMPVSAMFDNSREKEVVARGLERQDSLSCMQDTNVLTNGLYAKCSKLPDSYRATAPVHVHVPQLFPSKRNKVKVSLLVFIASLEESSGGDNK